MKLWMTLGLLCALTPASLAQVSCGDCNGDGAISILDGLASARIAGGIVAPTPVELCACDVNSDLAITVLDALLIAQLSAQLSVTLTCPMAVCGNQPPTVDVTAPVGGTFAAIVPITFDALDPDTDPLDLAFEFDLGGGFQPATSAGSGSVATSPAMGVAPAAGLTFDWDAAADGVGVAMTQTVSFRVTASDSSQAASDTTVFDVDNSVRPAPGTWTQLFPAQSPSARYGFGMAYDSARNVTVLFGGKEAGGSSATPGSDETWEFDGSNWTRRTPSLRPQGRYHHSMAYDAGRGVCVIQGGWYVNSQELRDSWEWDGSTWTQLGDLAPRWQQKMAYHAPSGQLVNGFGYSSGTSYNDLWIRSGSSWTQTFPSPAPSPRTEVGWEMDSTRGVLLLFGGWTGPLGDTWTWDGMTWAQASPAMSPPSMWGMRLADDAPRGRVVLFGGTTTGSVTGVQNGTWEWDGSTWIQRSPATSPSARIYHGMVFDVARDRVTLFGGAGTSSAINAETWIY